MVTYEALFAYTMVLIGLVSLVYQITKKPAKENQAVN